MNSTDQCPSCLSPLPAGLRFCPHCGVEMSDGMSRTGLGAAVAESLAAKSTQQIGGASTTDSDLISHGRFLPGTVLARRYRVVSMLGKGGMGEVYRADDLELGQSLALKFLPDEFLNEPGRLERFRREVRVARQIAHPNVCRVYDISQADGRYFLSMEYVDGEDLSAVLRRLGRPSKEKAIEIARQLCAGLAAAHANDVLHRDLKPANIMIDGRGRVRITDFGLAGVADSFRGGEIRAGTPAYMAPEQLSGKEVSVRSDIYALGLILYEVFTGQRLYSSNSVAELQRLHDSGSRTTPSNIVEDIDPAVERVILRCLEKDPAARPPSAIAVAAALPGGDPLAAALAAGETPSPELVAASGETGGLSPAVAIACLVFIIGCTFWLIALEKDFGIARLVPLPKPPEALADRAADILKRLGHSGPAVDSAYGFDWGSWDYMEHVRKTDKSPDRWKHLATRRPCPVQFWCRVSPSPLIPAKTEDISYDEPPLWASGSARMRLDPLGRLVQLEVVPPEKEQSTSQPAAASSRKPTDWTGLFQEAQIDMAQFKEVAPQWVPPDYCDERAAWEGRFADQPDVPIRVEAAAYVGIPYFMRIIEPETKPTRMNPYQSNVADVAGSIVFASLLALLILGGIFLTRRNLLLRRCDRKGAARLAAAFFLFVVTGWTLRSTFIPSVDSEVTRLIALASEALFLVSLVWLWYLALEPYVRKRWPQVLISWSRLLAGRFRDPLVGRDILVGVVIGVFGWFVSRGLDQVFLWVGGAPAIPQMPWPIAVLIGTRYQIGSMLIVQPIPMALSFLFLFLGLRVILRKQWIAVACICSILVFPDLLSSWNEMTPTQLIVFLAKDMAFLITMLVALLRFGLLSTIAFLYADRFVQYPFVLGLSGWQSTTSWMALAILGAMCGYSCYTSMAGRPLFRDELIEA